MNSASAFACRFAGEVKGFQIEDYIPAKEARHMDTFIHYGMAAAMQAVDHRRGDAARFENKTRHGRGQRPAFADGAGDGASVVSRRGVVCHRQPIFPFRRAMTPEIVSPSARAEKVSAMRCLRIGSASATTSSMDGA